MGRIAAISSADKPASALTPLAPTTIDPMSGAGVATMATQVLIGAAVGFVLKLVFEAVSFGGELVAGARMVDRRSHGRLAAPSSGVPARR